VFAETKITQENVAKKIVAIFDKYQMTSFDSDILGDAYEYFLKHNKLSKQNLGQFFTPRHIVKAMVALVAPTNNDTIYDPFCGTGGLLIGAFNAIKEFAPSNSKGMFFGKDTSVSSCVAQMNAILHCGVITAALNKSPIPSNIP